MAGELATGYISLIPSFRGGEAAIRRELSAAAGPAGSAAGAEAGKRFNTSFGSVLSKTAKGFGIISAAALAAGGTLAGFAIKSAADLEQTTVAFTSLLGSAKAAHKEIKDLQQFAAKTPFSQQDVFGYAQQFFALSNSIGLTNDQVKPFLSTIGDVAAVTGASTENIHNAVLAIAQMGSRGKVTLDNLNQLSQAFPGFNGAAAIAAATGETTAKVLKQINQGAVSAKVGVQALLQGMQKFPGAAGAMAKQSQTLKGVWSTFTDTLSIQLTKAFKPVIPLIKQTLTQLTPIIRDTVQVLAPAITAFIQDLGPALKPIIQGLGTALSAVFQVLGPALKAITPVIQPLAKAFAQLVLAVKPIVLLLARIIAQLGPPLIGLFHDLLTFLRPVIRALSQALAPVLPVLAQSFRQIATALRPVAKQLGQALAKAIAEIAPYLPDLVRSATDLAIAFIDLLDPLLKLLDPLIKFQGVLASLVAKGFTVLLEGLARLIQHITGWLKQAAHWAEQLWEYLKLATGQDVVVNGVGSLSPALQNVAAQAHNAALEMQLLATSAQQVLNIGAALANGDFAAAGAQAVVNAGKDLVAHAKASAGLGGTDLHIGGKGAGKDLPPFDQSTLSSFLQQAIGFQINPLVAALNSIIASAKAAGKGLTQGFIDQLKGENTRLIGLVNRRDAITARIESVQQRLANLRQQRAQIAQSTKQAITGTFDITTAGQNDFGEPVTFFDIKSAITTAVRNATRFVHVMKRLAKEGLPGPLLAQLAEAGPGALPQAQALLSATPKQLAGLKSQFRQLTTQGKTLGKFIGNDLKGAGIQAAQGLIQGLRSKKSALVDAIRDLARAMVDQLKQSLGIHSPSKVMRDLGSFSGQGFAHGLASRYADVRREADRLSNAALPMSQLRAWQGGGPGGGGAGAPITIHQHFPMAVPEPASRSQNAAFRAARYALGR